MKENYKSKQCPILTNIFSRNHYLHIRKLEPKKHTRVSSWIYIEAQQGKTKNIKRKYSNPKILQILSTLKVIIKIKYWKQVRTSERVILFKA